MAPPQKYPWTSWLDGQDKTLVAGEDFPRDIKLRHLARQIRDRARDEGEPCAVRIVGDKRDAIELEFIDDGIRRRGRYDWDTLLDGEMHGVQFDELGCEPESFRRYAWTVARGRDRNIRVNIFTARRILSIQAVGPYKKRQSVASASPSDAQLRELSARAMGTTVAPAREFEITPEIFDSYQPRAARTSAEFGDDEFGDEFISEERPS